MLIDTTDKQNKPSSKKAPPATQPPPKLGAKRRQPTSGPLEVEDEEPEKRIKRNEDGSETVVEKKK